MKNNLDDFILNKTLCEKSLYDFTKQAFKILKPRDKFVDNWHIELLCDYLQCIAKNIPVHENARQYFKGLSSDFRITHLLICMPPRSLKSVCVSTTLNAWHWIENPYEQFLCASSTYKLSVEHALNCRKIIFSDWYQLNWGKNFNLAEDQNTKNNYRTNFSGSRNSVSVDSKITGMNGDILVADDLNDMGEVESVAKRTKALLFWNQVFTTRENNPETSRKIIMQQRGHALDIAGDVIAKENEIPVTKLILKAEATEDEDFYSPLTGKLIHSRKSGDVLCETRLSKDFLRKRKKQVGERAYNAQFQQKPNTDSGNIIKPHLFKRLAEDPKPARIFQSIDTAFKEGEENDFSVCMTIYEYYVENISHFHIKHIIKGRWAFPELLARIKMNIKMFKPNKVLIEDKASGQSIIQTLRTEYELKVLVEAVQVDKDKVARAYAITNVIEQGRVSVPESAPWLAEFIDELESFPFGSHDDSVDTLTQGLNWATNKKHPQVRTF
jgi:predicted phage terminase large subunit-like protein